MNLKNIVSIVFYLSLAVLISACGGGGGGESNGFSPSDLRVTVTATSINPLAGQAVDVTVRVTEASGALVSDGTSVTGVLSPAGLGSITGIGTNGPNGSNTASTLGGLATFRFVGNGSGAVTATFSVSRNAATFTGAITFQVAPGIDRVTIQATTTTLPVNRFNIDPFFGSPYMAEVTVTVRTASGQLVSAPEGLAVSVNPVGNTGGFSTLDDPTTEDDPNTPEIENNEFLTRLGQGPVNINAGKSTIFFHSLNFSGQSTLTVSAQDPETLETISAQLVFNIVSTTPPLPATVQVTATNRAQYITSSGGPTSGQFEILVTDAIDQPVPNPTSGNTAFNNLRAEFIGDALGARLSGINAAGASVSGSTISTRTTSGIGGAVLISGDTPGNVRIRVTSDRADNNVDNGISDPVFGERTVAISDGILFDLDITQPAPAEVPVVSNEDGSYSATVSVIATDRLGNPVLPGTTITFGLIDEPQQLGVGDFFLSGLDGDPQEGGTLFTAPGGAFLTAGGGAGPGDALVLFGEDLIGNRDHESARRIASVNSQTSLTVQRRFNHNDTTGSIVNSGPVLPYVIGRAADGNVLASATTNVLGVATTIMDYPVSKLGKVAVVWAQGDGDIVAGMPETVGDAEFLVFSGIAPATLFADPATIIGNTTAQVDVCIVDALGAGIGGVFVGFSYASDESGALTVNGVPAPGTAPIPTSFGTGCATLEVATTGVLGGGTITFTGAGAEDTVDVVVGTQILIARPSFFTGSGSRTTTLTLSDANGVPVSGIQLVGSCTVTAASDAVGGASLTTAPVSGENGVTDANGEARFNLVATGINSCTDSSPGATPGDGSCTYTTILGDPSATVTIQGVDASGFSPPCSGP